MNTDSSPATPSPGNVASTSQITVDRPAQSGRVVSLHLHPPQSGAPFQAVQEIELVQATGIVGDNRYFGRRSGKTGTVTRRQVSLIEREQIAEHAAALGLETIPPGAARANVETLGVNLIELIGCEVEIGEAVLKFYEPRDPCAKMDAVCQGLRERMMNSRQGVMAEIVKSGRIRVGDTLRPRQSGCSGPA